jgi:hypothetical protein
VPKPPHAEQQRIAQVLSTVQQAIEQQERLIRTTTELKQALMQKLFTEGLRGEAQKETEIGAWCRRVGRWLNSEMYSSSRAASSSPRTLQSTRVMNGHTQCMEGMVLWVIPLNHSLTRQH